jgi:hypothetical protein
MQNLRARDARNDGRRRERLRFCDFIESQNIDKISQILSAESELNALKLRLHVIGPNRKAFKYFKCFAVKLPGSVQFGVSHVNSAKISHVGFFSPMVGSSNRPNPHSLALGFAIDDLPCR